MKTRLQYCPVCMKKTPHVYQPMSIVIALLLFMCGLLPGLLYVWYAVRRADRTCCCSVDHQILEAAREEERVRELIRVIQQTNGSALAPRRGTGFMR